MLDYALVQAVAAVVREGSFERASQSLNVTPSAISQRIKLLEERLGAVLIVRGQPCTATEIGLKLCRHAELVGALEVDLGQSLKRGGVTIEDEQPPILRVAVNADSFDSWFMKAWELFAKSEHVRLDVIVDDQDHTAEFLRRGEALAAVSASARPVQGCRSVFLGALRYVPTASPTFVKRYFSQGVNAQTLASAPALAFNRKDRLQENWVKQVTKQSISLSESFVPSPQSFIAATVSGLGWGLNPLPLANELLEEGKLVEFYPKSPLDMPLYWQHSRVNVPMLDRLTSCVCEVAHKYLQQAKSSRKIS